MRTLSKTFFKKFLLLGLALMLTGAGCTNGPTAEALKASQRTELNVWGVIDDDATYTAVLDDYHKLHSNVQINFRRLRLENYEQTLVDAMAEDRGPDVFLIHNTWTGKYLPKIVPMPPTTKVAYHIVSGTIKKTDTWEMRTEPTLTLRQLRDGYADAVAQDVIRTLPDTSNPKQTVMRDQIVGLPIMLDTMALYYNKDLLNAAGIPTPPENWAQFQDQVKKLVKLDPQGNILQAGAGIGTAANVERGTDLLTALMMQNGARMAADDGTPTFHLIPPELNGQRQTPPAYQALQFYIDFANPAKETYTWNANQPNSLEAFIQGKSAFFFGFAYHLPQIRARAPKINLGIAKLPQIENSPMHNVANYWYWTVSKKAKNTDMAWNLLMFMSQPDESQKILDSAKRPSARRNQLTAQLADDDVGVFAAQVLTASSWYRGNDPKVMEAALQSMIVDAGTGADQLIPNAMRFAADKISQTFAAPVVQ